MKARADEQDSRTSGYDLISNSSMSSDSDCDTEDRDHEGTPTRSHIDPVSIVLVAPPAKIVTSETQLVKGESEMFVLAPRASITGPRIARLWLVDTSVLSGLSALSIT